MPTPPPAPELRIPVILLTGFLGSGKTTRLNRMLAEAPLTAVVMNEFGEVGLDHQLLEHSQGPLALLSGGCVCCQIQGSLAPTLRNLWLARAEGRVPAYVRLIIETTGLADPAPVAATLVGDRWLAERHRLAGIVTCVDAEFGLAQLDAHVEARRQVASADRLLLTKTDRVAAAVLAPLRQRLAELNPGLEPVVVSADAPAATFLSDPDLFEAGSDPTTAQRWLAARRYRPVQADPGERGIRAFQLRFERSLPRLGVMSALEMLQSFRGAQLLRMKAIVDFSGEARPTVLHAVQHVLYPPRQLAEWPDGARLSQFVFIVDGLDPGTVEKLLTDFAAAAEQGALAQKGMA